MTDKPYSAACDKNCQPIFSIIETLFANCTVILEIGSGTGQHAVYFAEKLPHLLWHTSDLQENHAGIKMWLHEAGLSNTPPPLVLDVTQAQWPDLDVNAVFSANAIHIMGWEAVKVMIAGVGKLLPERGMLVLYGPFNYGNDYTSDSNARFDVWLKEQDPKSGIRNFEDIDKLANAAGMYLQDDFDMPANNRILCWMKKKTTKYRDKTMSDFDESSEIQRYWNEEGGHKWVENIDAVELMILPMSNKLLEQTAVRTGEFILDVGCGGGATSINLAGQVGDTGKVLGLDVSTPIISIATDRGAGIANLEFQLGDAASTDLGEACFDLITSRFGVMFFDDPVAAFSNFHKALKASGRLVFMCWQTIEKNPWMGEPTAATFEILPPPADTDPPDPTAPGPFSLGDAGHLQTILQSAGFNIIDLQSIDIPMDMGSLDEAVGFMMKLGPAADAIQAATKEEKVAVAAAIGRVMEKYDTDSGVSAPAATWIVKATK